MDHFRTFPAFSTSKFYVFLMIYLYFDGAKNMKLWNGKTSCGSETARNDLRPNHLELDYRPAPWELNLKHGHFHIFKNQGVCPKVFVYIRFVHGFWLNSYKSTNLKIAIVIRSAKRGWFPEFTIIPVRKNSGSYGPIIWRFPKNGVPPVLIHWFL